MYHAVDIAMKKKCLVLLMVIPSQEEMEAEKWNAELLSTMKGTTWQPTPGQSIDCVRLAIPQRKAKAVTARIKAEVELKEADKEASMPKAALMRR